MWQVEWKAGGMDGEYQSMGRGGEGRGDCSVRVVVYSIWGGGDCRVVVYSMWRLWRCMYAVVYGEE